MRGIFKPPPLLPRPSPPRLPLPLLLQIAAEFSKQAPIDRLRAHGRPWEGMLCMQPIIQELEALLPGSFADLQRGTGR